MKKVEFTTDRHVMNIIATSNKMGVRIAFVCKKRDERRKGFEKIASKNQNPKRTNQEEATFDHDVVG